jgi:hypothetical protein
MAINKFRTFAQQNQHSRVPLWLVNDRVAWVGVLLRIASKSSTRCLFAYSKALYSRTLAPSSSQRPQFSSASRRTAGGARTHRNAPGDLGKPRGTCRSGQPTNGMAGPLMRGRKYIASVRLVRADYRVTLRLGAHMRILRREFISGLVGAAATWPVAGRAQQTEMPVVGFLHRSSPGGYASRVAAFRQGVNEAGYIEVRNVTIEYRWAEGQKPAEAGCCVPRPVPTASVGQEQTSAIQRYEIELAVIE